MYLSILHTHNQAKSIKRSRAIEPSLLQRGRCHICDAFAKVSSVRPWLYTHQLEKMSFKFNTVYEQKSVTAKALAAFKFSCNPSMPATTFLVDVFANKPIRRSRQGAKGFPWKMPT